jgi:hypothetical protein
VKGRSRLDGSEARPQEAGDRGSRILLSDAKRSGRSTVVPTDASVQSWTRRSTRRCATTLSASRFLVWRTALRETPAAWATGCGRPALVRGSEPAAPRRGGYYGGGRGNKVTWPSRVSGRGRVGRACERAGKQAPQRVGGRARRLGRGGLAPRALSRMSRGQQVEVWRRALTMRLLRSLGAMMKRRR